MKKPSHAAHVLPPCCTGVAPCLLHACSKRSPNALLTDDSLSRFLSILLA